MKRAGARAGRGVPESIHFDLLAYTFHWVGPLELSLPNLSMPQAG